MTYQDLDSFTRAYIECALWSSNGPKFGECPCCGRMALLSRLPEPEYEQEPMCDATGCGVREIPNDEPLDSNYKLEDLAPEALARMASDCQKFQTDNASDLVAFSPYDSQNGQDFWLTRNGHGSGFWDHNPEPKFEDLAERLTKASHAFGECDIYPGDDGKLYVTPA